MDQLDLVVKMKRGQNTCLYAPALCGSLKNDIDNCTHISKKLEEIVREFEKFP